MRHILAVPHGMWLRPLIYLMARRYASDIVHVNKDVFSRLPEDATISVSVNGLRVKDLKNIMGCFYSDVLENASDDCEDPTTAEALELFIEKNKKFEVDSWYRFKDVAMKKEFDIFSADSGYENS